MHKSIIRKCDRVSLYLIMLLLLSVAAAAQYIEMPPLTNNLSKINYVLEIGSLDLAQGSMQEHNSNYTQNETLYIINSTINITYIHAVQYACKLNISINSSLFYRSFEDSGTLDGDKNISHLLNILMNESMNVTINSSSNESLNGSVNNSASQNNTLKLDDGLYVVILDCIYTVASNMTSLNMTTLVMINTSLPENNTFVETFNETSEILRNTTYNITDLHEVMLDTSPPIITIYSPNASYNITSNMQNILFNFSISEPASCNMLLNGLIYENISTEFTVSLDQGHHNYTIQCNDTAGNTNDTSGNFTLTKIEPPIFFELELNKQSFNLGEIGQYRINASDGSNVSITICPLAQGWVQCWMTPEFKEEDYPILQNMPYSNKTGRYIIEGVMRYGNNTLRRNLTYEVVNSLNALITVSDKKVPKNTIVTFNATASGGIGNYVYNWLMHDGAKFTGFGAYKNYTQPGKYIVQLFVNDSQNNTFNTSTEITVKDRYKLTVIVSDASKGNKLSGVWIGVDDFNVSTNSNGEASLLLPEGDYDVFASKDSYGAVVKDIDLDKNSTLYINMSFEDFDKPRITLLTSDKSVFVSDAIKLKFKANDQTTLRCELYLLEGEGEWYEMKDFGDNLLVDTEYTFELSLDSGAYNWKIDCIDRTGNRATSEKRTFISTDETAVNALADNDYASEDINAAIEKIYSKSGGAGEIVEWLGMKSSIREYLDRSASFERDIHNLAFRRDLDAEGKKQAEKDLADSLSEMRERLPVDIEVLEEKSYIKYINEKDLEKAIDEYVASKSMNINRKQFLQSTKKAQSMFIVSTKARNVMLYYADGKTSQMTFIVKDIQVPKLEDASYLASSQTVSFIEVIPKNIAVSAKSINIIGTEYNIIKDDPLIEFPAKIRKIIYYINTSIDLEDTKAIDTLLVERKVTVSSPTGFIIFDDVKEYASDGKVILIAIILLLIFVYLFVNFDLWERLKNLNPNIKRKVSYMRVLINDAKDYMETSEYDKASMVYREIKLNYESSPEKVRKELFKECYSLCNNLDIEYFKELNERFLSLKKIGQDTKALAIYDIMEKTYSKIDEEFKKPLAPQMKFAFESISTDNRPEENEQKN